MCHEVAAAGTKRGDEGTTDLSEHMLAFANDQLTFVFGYMLGPYVGFVAGFWGGKAGPDCMGSNSAKAASRTAAAAGQAAGGQGGQQVVMCPQDAQLNTVWIADVSVAISPLHAIDEGRQKMCECANELDCIAKQNPRLLSFAVVCAETGGHLNGQLWGRAPNNVVPISMGFGGTHPGNKVTRRLEVKS